MFYNIAPPMPTMSPPSPPPPPQSPYPDEYTAKRTYSPINSMPSGSSDFRMSYPPPSFATPPPNYNGTLIPYSNMGMHPNFHPAQSSTPQWGQPSSPIPMRPPFHQQHGHPVWGLRPPRHRLPGFSPLRQWVPSPTQNPRYFPHSPNSMPSNKPLKRPAPTSNSDENADVLFKKGKKAKKNKTDADGDEDDLREVKSKRRRPLAYKRGKMWNRADAMKALQAETELTSKEDRMLMMIFPDTPITLQMVEGIDPAISKPHFQLPCGPRFCFFQVKEGYDVQEVAERLNEVEFLNLGKLTVKLKSRNTPVVSPVPERIDPYTLYLGNIPLNVTPAAVKEKFATANRVDMGYAQKIKNTRYAFIGYQTVEDAIEAFKKCSDISFDSRTCVLRFRRQKYQIEEPAAPSQLKSLSTDRIAELQKMERMERCDETTDENTDSKKFNPNKKMGYDNLLDDDEEKEVNDEVDYEEDDDEDDIPVNGISKEGYEEEDTLQSNKVRIKNESVIKQESRIKREITHETEETIDGFDDEEKEVDDNIVEEED